MKYLKMLIYLICVLITIVKSDKKEEIERKNRLPYFIRLVKRSEELNLEGPQLDDRKPNLVSFLAKNVREIFSDIYTTDADDIYFNTTFPLEILRPSKEKISRAIAEDPKLKDVATTYKNMSLGAMIDTDIIQPVLMTKNKLIETQVPMLLAKTMRPLEISQHPSMTSNSPFVLHYTDFGEDNPGRSCIFCDNIKFEDCSDPRNKLVPSILCEREGDLCYSQHTPFGIIDRGCFNINYNLTTYVCSCNLCNFIPITEMPFIFSSKRDWVDNVVELSHMRNLRNSVHKDMSCLKCEVNMTSRRENRVFSTNCLEGHIGTLPTEICQENEICAIKAIRNQGYVWRGCTKGPLYNYWWSLCDSDLCNYETLVSLYDFT